MYLINGEQQKHLAVTDRGLHYGDGLFETIAIRNAKPSFWHYHIERLTHGCGRLGIPVPDERLLAQEAATLCHGQARAILKIIITRGSGGRGYQAPESVKATRLLGLYPWPDYPDNNWSGGVALRYCSTPLACNPRLAGIKHLNRLEQVMARAEWHDSAIAEGLMCDLQGHVIEGTMSNLFLVNDGQLLTPKLEHCGVEGVMRRVILEQAGALGLTVSLCNIERETVDTAEEVFICNSVFGLWPVKTIGDVRYTPGPVSRCLAEQIHSLMEQ